MYRRILVPLDGSHSAEEVLPLVAALARASAGAALLLHLRDNAPTGDFQPAMPGDDPYLDALEQQVDFSGVSVLRGIANGCDAATISGVGREWGADVIVLRCRRSETVQTRVDDRIAWDTVRLSQVPVMLLRQELPPLLSGSRSGRSAPLRCLVPLDGSPEAEMAIIPALNLIGALAGSSMSVLHLMRVVPTENQWREAARYLDALAARLRRRSASLPFVLSVNWSVIAHIDVAEAVERIAEHGEDDPAISSWSIARHIASTPSQSHGFTRCDIVALTTHGRGGLRRWTIGSVAEGILRRTELPVLILRPRPVASHTLEDDIEIERWRVRQRA